MGGVSEIRSTGSVGFAFSVCLCWVPDLKADDIFTTTAAAIVAAAATAAAAMAAV